MKFRGFYNRIKRCMVLCLKDVLTCAFFLFFIGCNTTNKSPQKLSDMPEFHQSDIESTSIDAKPNGTFKAYQTTAPVKIDGYSNDAIWSNTNWYGINYLWMGEAVDSLDYHGKFKLAWDRTYLYILVEIVDDVLNPTLKNGIENYWKGDYVEVFIDEDASGGNHQFNHQAFAYHVSTEGHAIDKNMSKETVFLDDHVKVKRSHKGNKYLWEMAIKLFDNHFDESAPNNIPVEIVAQKRIGFSIAYGDNDGNNSRENFMGSKRTHGKNNDEGYINADVFGSIVFLE